MRWRRRAAATAVLAAGLAALSGCGAASPASPTAQVVVRIEAADRPHYDVRLAQAHGGFATTHRMRPGETRTFTVPAGWLTVRVPGRCVVPTPNTGTTVVEVDSSRCTLS